MVPEINLLHIHFGQISTTRSGLIRGEMRSASSFSSILNNIIVGQKVAVQKDIAQKSSDISCSCDKTKKCICDSDDKTNETVQTKKTGLAACMECSFRESGQCELWNEKEDDFAMLTGTSHNTSIINPYRQPVLRTNFIPEIPLDYNNAYAYVKRKKSEFED